MTCRTYCRDGWLIASLLLLAVATAFPAVMSTLAPYDDQGYVMITLDSFLRGAPLYAQTHTQYGPAYYLLSGSLHSVFGLPITQDAVRMKTIVFWCTSTLLVFSIQRRLAVTPLIALAMSLLFHLHLYKLALEPGHPQEWILLLSLLSFWIVVGKNRMKYLLAAMLVGLIGMIKINCGLFFAIPLIIQSLIANKQDDARRYAFAMVVLGGTISALSIGTFSFLLGVSIEQLAWGLIGQHRRFSGQFFHSVPISLFPIAYALVCVYILYRTRREADFETRGFDVRSLRTMLGQTCVLAAGISIVAIQTVTDWVSPQIHGLEPRGAANWLAIIGPVASLWLVLSIAMRHQYGWYIVLTTCCAPLMAYPTPGTQLTLGTSPSWIVFGIIATNLTQAWVSRSAQQYRTDVANLSRVPPFGSMGFWCISAILALTPASMSWHRWLSYERVELPGTSLLRLDPKTTAREVSVAKAIERTDSHRLVFDGHNHNRFFFWTNTKPLTDANPTFWPRMLTNDEQDRILSALQTDESICMVIPPESDSLSSDRTRSVREALYRGWQETERVGDWRIGIIKPAARP